MTDLHLAKKYPSKLLLFGEHIVLKGAQALAVPLPKFYGQWNYSSDFSKQMNLCDFVDYLAVEFSDFFDVSVFRQLLAKGLYFQSNIPTGYGAGSSGALVAAVFDTFSKDKSVILRADLKSFLGKMESFFHGASSGVDPLICYLEENILLEGTTKMQAVELPDFSKMGNWTIFLLNTKIPRKTGPLVNLFLEKCKNPAYLSPIETVINPLNNKAIVNFLQGNWALLFENLHVIGTFQKEYFLDMIPPVFQPVWENGLSGNLFKLKLCGAGGGGFLLGITEDLAVTQQKLSNWDLQSIFHS